MTRKSHHNANSIPPATAGPSTADRLVQFEPRGAERAAWNFAAVAARPRRRDIELAERIIGIERAHVFEIPAGAKRPARAVEHGDGGILVGIEFKKRGGQRIGAFRIHGVAGFGPVVNDRPYRSVLLDPDCHVMSSSRPRSG
jgi:hypothetical protein